MPNWSNNYLEIEGTVKDVRAFANALLTTERHPYVSLRGHGEAESFCNEDYTYTPEQFQAALDKVKNTVEKLKEPILTMNNIVPMPMEFYVDRQNTIDENGKGCGADWYDWHIANWGTKWDICDADASSFLEEIKELEALADDEETTIGFSYATAWSPPEAFLCAASKKYPDVRLNCTYEEESGAYYVDTTWENGEEDEHYSTENEVDWRIYQGNSIDEILESFTWGCDGERIDSIIEGNKGEDFIKSLRTSFTDEAIEKGIVEYFDDVNKIHNTPVRNENGEFVRDENNQLVFEESSVEEEVNEVIAYFKGILNQKEQVHVG